MRGKSYTIIDGNAKKAWAKKSLEWQKNAAFWITIIREQLDPFRIELNNAAVLEYFLRKKNLRVLDAGCGEGYLCRALARMGHRAVGVDFNRALIKAAKDLEAKEQLGIEYKLADIKKIPYPDADFDAILSVHAVNELDNPALAIKEFSRVLKPGGRAVVFFLHPCFDLNPNDLGGKYPATYFSKVKVERSCYLVGGVKSPSPYFYLHLPLSDWIDAFSTAGFLIETIKEPHPAAETFAASKWWQENYKKPLFILIQAVKKHC